MIDILANLIRNILDVDVFIVDSNSNNLKEFENEENYNGFSYDLSYESLKPLLESLEKKKYYELVDNLNQRIFIFKVEDLYIIVGPYIKKFLGEIEIEKIGSINKIPPSLIESLKFHFYGLPIIDSYYLEKTINSILKSLNSNKFYPYAYKKIDNYKINKPIEREYKESNVTEKAIYEKYEIENSLLYQVEHGQVEEIKLSLENIASVAKEEYLIDFYTTNPQAAMASYRTLIRKSAEKSGLPVPIIDRIISKHTQIMLSSSSLEQMKTIASLAIELTSEIRNYLLNTKYNSPLIKNVCDYLYVHYNQNFKIKDFANKFNISEYYLLHVFKKETNKTINNYLEDIRITKAKEMLKDNLLSIAEISNLVGYEDNNYFTKVFKKKCDITPSKYRSINAK
jgi:two-component system, response regulator YesN